LYGDPATELIRTSCVVDLMVLGSRGCGPRRGALLGSVSTRVIQAAGCPVIVVPQSAPEGSATDAAAARQEAGVV
jgi:nucleotide-binding universal stress UspA family protein